MDERGWRCLYCDQLIGRAPDDPLPHDKTQNEHECNIWYRNRFARLAEWERRAALGLVNEDWHIGWEPKPLPDHIKAKVKEAAVMSMSMTIAAKTQTAVASAVPEQPVYQMRHPLSAHVTNMLWMHSNSTMRLEQMMAYFAAAAAACQPEPFVRPATPANQVPDELVEFLDTPAKLALDIAVPLMSGKDVEMVEDGVCLPPKPDSQPQIVVPQLQASPQLQTVTHQPALQPLVFEHIPMAPSSPTVESPMEVEQAVTVLSDPADADAPFELEVSAALTPAPSSPHDASSSLVGSPLSDVPDSPDMVASALLPADDVKTPQSPTSSAIAALLPDLDTEADAPKPKKKKSLFKKTSKSATMIPEVKLPKGPNPKTARAATTVPPRGGSKEPVILKIPSRTQIATPASFAKPAPKSKAAMLSNMGLTSKTISTSTTPAPSPVTIPEGNTASPAAARPAALKLWQSTKIPKKTAFQPPTPVGAGAATSAYALPSTLHRGPPNPSARSRA